MKIAVIGCGVMGTALARHLVKKHEVILCSRDKKKREVLAKEIGAIAQEQITDAVRDADVIFLAVKPKDLPSLAQSISPAFSSDKLLVSMLAGIPIEVLKRYFPLASVLRIMPNLALTSGQGVIGLVDDGRLCQETKDLSFSLFEGLGLNIWLPENKIEALTALTASGIGFVFLFIEAMIEGGVCMGFTAQEAKELVAKTMEGAVSLMQESGKHPAELKLSIASPGGTTIAGLKELEDRGVRSGIINALLASFSRGRNLLSEIEKK